MGRVNELVHDIIDSMTTEDDGVWISGNTGINSVQQKGTAALDTAIQDIVEQVSPLQVNVYGNANGRAAMICVMKNSKNDVFVFAKKFLSKKSLGPNGIF